MIKESVLLLAPLLVRKTLWEIHHLGMSPMGNKIYRLFADYLVLFPPTQQCYGRVCYAAGPDK